MATDRFVSKVPTFQLTTNAAALEAMTPKPKDTTPAPSMVARVASIGNVDLAALLASTQAAAREHAKILESEKKPRTPRKPKEETQAGAPKVAVPKFQPSDILDDASFIRKTRDIDIHTPEARALFWANGGEVVAGLTYAQSYDNLRRYKLSKIKHANSATPAPYQRNTVVQGARLLPPGTPTTDDHIRRREGVNRAERMAANEKWACFRR